MTSSTRRDKLPVSIRSATKLGAGFEQRIRNTVDRHFGATRFVERATVRFEDLNGPKGGIDSMCRIKLVLTGRPSVQIDKTASSFDVAFARAFRSICTAIGRARDKYRLHGGRRVAAKPRLASRAERAPDSGELIGRRTGRGPDAKARAAARPGKTDRTFYVDTAEPERSSTDRRAGGDTTVRRNSRVRHPRATVTLEDSRTRPSRKSTRRSANRSQPSQTKGRAVAAALTSPSVRTARQV
ncbi:MAG: hypothetical protein ABI467_25645 [Kofleriaceae bacterium]